MGILTLTTDFGMRDGYVGSMKGVILGIAPNTMLVDISHEMTPQDVMEGSYVVASAFACYPKGTVHLVVVDPGVGSNRRGIVVKTSNHWFVAPDNGVLSAIFFRHACYQVFSIENALYFRETVSPTFHGRDIFAPVAAAILNGENVSEFGPALQDPVMLDPWQVEVEQGFVQGYVVHVDRFGNCVTQIRGKDLDRAGLAANACRVTVGDHNLKGIGRTYSDVQSGKPIALFGSGNTLEIAVHAGSAAEWMGIARGDRVKLQR